MEWLKKAERNLVILLLQLCLPALGILGPAKTENLTRPQDPVYAEYLELEAMHREEELFVQMQKEPEAEPTETEEPEEESPGETASALPSILSPDTGLNLRMEQALSSCGISLENALDLNYILPQLYVVSDGIPIDTSVVNPEAFLKKDLRLKGSSQNPQILIYHTHSQEAFADSEPGNMSQTIVGVGERLTEILRDTYGFHVIHHTGVYDMTDGKLDRDPAYTKALPDLEQILAENPSIELVIDLHRDGVREDLRLVTEIDGKPTARLMLFNGLCRNAGGDIPGLIHPYREQNLAFSFQLMLEAKAVSPDWPRFIYMRPMRYNQHLGPVCALIEVGAQTNTVEEAMNAMEPLAEIIDKVIGK